MDTVEEFAYADRNNSIDWQLLEDKVPLDITGLTRVTLHAQDRNNLESALIVLDSNLHANVFDWTTRGADGVLQINGGELATTIGIETDYHIRLTIYDAELTKGLVWTHEQRVRCDGTFAQINIVAVPDGAPP